MSDTYRWMMGNHQNMYLVKKKSNKSQSVVYTVGRSYTQVSTAKTFSIHIYSSDNTEASGWPPLWLRGKVINVSVKWVLVFTLMLCKNDKTEEEQARRKMWERERKQTSILMQIAANGFSWIPNKSQRWQHRGQDRECYPSSITLFCAKPALILFKYASPISCLEKAQAKTLSRRMITFSILPLRMDVYT